MEIPIITLKNTLDSLLGWVRTNTLNNVDADTWLYHTFNGVVTGNFNFFSEAKELVTRDVTNPRKLETRFMYDKSRAELPTVHIHMPSENVGDFNSISSGALGEELMPNDEDYGFILGRSYTTTYDLIITGSSSTEILLIYELLKALFMAGASTLQHNFEVFDYSGNELMANPELIPNNIFYRAFRVTLKYEQKVRTIDSYPTVVDIASINDTRQPMPEISYQRGYGYLYNWWAVREPVVSGDDWRVSSLGDWNILRTYVGGNLVAGGVLKSTRTSPTPHPRWNSPNTGATDAYNLELYAAGYRNSSGSFTYLGLLGYYWTITGNYVVTFRWDNFNGSEQVSNWPAVLGNPVRILRNATENELILPDGSYCDDYIGNDGKRYRTVKIGTQVWLAANLAETKYRDGGIIPFEAIEGQGNYTNGEWAALNTPARCAYNNFETYVTIDY